MTKVLIATEKPFAPAAVSQIQAVCEGAGFSCVLLEKYTGKAELLDAVADVEAIIIRSDIIDAEVMDAAKNLKIVVRAGAGFDNVDIAAAKERGICVMNTPGQNANAVAELVIGMMLFDVRNRFAGTAGTELKGKKIGIHAYGNVGRNVARIAKGLDMEVFAFDPFCPKEVITADGVTVCDTVEDLYRNCNFISLHIPANEHTKKSIGKNLLSLMPEQAMLVNTARKEVIDEESVLAFMEERKDFSYVSDIAPDAKDSFINKFADRCFFTPKKMGAQTAEANVNAGIAAANQIVGFIKEGDNTFQVNK